MAEWIVSSSVLIAVVILLRFALKGKISLRLQYALWGLVLVRLLIPVSFGGTAMSVGNLTQKAAASETAQYVAALSETELPRMTYQAAYNEVAKEYADKGIRIEDLSPDEYAETIDYEIMNKQNSDLTVAEIVRILWVGGIAVVGAWFLYSNLRLQRSLKKTRTLLTDTRRLPVYLSEVIDTPCLFGLFRPAIYLTDEAIESEHIYRHAVEHELTHFRHKDHIWAILRSVCLAVHWFNPLVWCAAVLSRNDAELACDESTILRLGEEERASYGRTLIRLTCEKRPALLNTATTMTGSGTCIKERIALIVKKPRMALYTLIAVLLLIAVAAGCTFTGAKELESPWSWAQSLAPEEITAAVPWAHFGNLTSLTDEETAKLVNLLNALESKNFEEVPEPTEDPSAYGLTLQTADGEYRISGSTAVPGALEMDDGEKQWRLNHNELTTLIRELTEREADVSVPETEAETELPSGEYKLQGFSVQAEGSYPEIGQQWAEAFVSQYATGVSGDHPLKSTDCAVLECELFAESLEAVPKSLIFNMRFACLAEDPHSFEAWYAGWAGPLTSEQDPQHVGWMEFGNYIVLKQTEAGLWTCMDAGTGGYGGWGWLNYEEAGEADFRMEQLLSGEEDFSVQLLLRVLPFVDWSDFDSTWGAEGWNALRQLLESSCISQGQVYGPEETRMWSDVYPDDQLYRNLYLMLTVQNSDGAYREGLADILRRQNAYDPVSFEACLQKLPPEQREELRDLLEAP